MESEVALHQIRPGDFVQTGWHFSDVFFEVDWVIGSLVCLFTYGKYDSMPNTIHYRLEDVVAVIPKEMAEPVMISKGLRFQSSRGQFDPFFGYAPAGRALRTRNGY